MIRLTASVRQRIKQVELCFSAELSPTETFIALPYSWKQTLQDVDVIVPVPKGTRARELAVVIAKKKLSVGPKGEEPIMAGELCQDIKVEESTWTLG